MSGPRFVRRSEDREKDVVLTLNRGDHGVAGDVFGPTTKMTDRAEFESRDFSTGLEARDCAIRMARLLGTNVLVEDPLGLWDEAWGTIED